VGTRYRIYRLTGAYIQKNLGVLLLSIANGVEQMLETERKTKAVMGTGFKTG
jgi:hypothetical protein